MKKALIILVILGLAGIWYVSRAPELPEPVAYQSPRHPERNDRGEAEGVEPRDPVDTETSSDSRPDPSAPSSSAETADSSVAQSLPRTRFGDDVLGEYNLAVPFQPQAPHANWDMPYQEACEEAALIMAARFFTGGSLSAQEMDDAIKQLVSWEQETFGYYEDTTAQEVALMAQEYFGLTAALDYDVRLENIKRHISQNKLVVVPAAGRELPNPYFTGEGPLYHMLVIRGYTETQFITNDPGTKRGEEFLYRYDDLINAIHDWPRPHGGFKDSVTDEEMRNGTPVLIVLDQ